MAVGRDVVSVSETRVSGLVSAQKISYTSLAVGSEFQAVEPDTEKLHDPYHNSQERWILKSRRELDRRHERLIIQLSINPQFHPYSNKHKLHTKRQYLTKELIST